jgi:hypothetical protein
MKSGTNFESGQWQSKLEAIATAVRALAQSCQGDSLALVALLRRLEELHREIRDGFFQASLPNNRQALYTLLKDIEAEGGWPYIERMKLQSFLANLAAEAVQHTGALSQSIEDKTATPTNIPTIKDSEVVGTGLTMEPVGEQTIGEERAVQDSKGSYGC